MGIVDIAKTLVEAPALLKAQRQLKPQPLATKDCLSAHLEDTVRRFPHHTAVIFEGRSLTWTELNALANQYVGALRDIGLRRGDTASLFMENRIEFLASLIALNKLGVTAALINTNLTGKPLIHCLKITDSRACIFGEERCEPMDEVRQDPELTGIATYLFVPDAGKLSAPGWSEDLSVLSSGRTTDNPVETGGNTLGDTALNIFTSGTTGLPKASVISNRRLLFTAALSYLTGLKCTEKDCIYLCLPLYHGTGLFLGVGASFATGACMFVRRKFSASNFLPEVREHGATCFVYIGELCRYLLNTPEHSDDYKSPLTTMMGNGLRPDVWHEFKTRFGVRRIAEFYGSSEGNVGFVNMLNKDCTVGTTTVPLALVKYDVHNDEIVRDAQGRLIRVEDGQPGLLLGKITQDTVFEGYTSAAETEKKIIRDAFEDGDAWFNTGDLMKTVDVGFSLGMAHYQFVDRVGDTFRWKSENVSTNEVGEILNGHPQVDFCNVYGVDIPQADGKAGMAAIVLAEGVTELDLGSFSAWVNDQLPSYARPVFLRIQRELDTTGTFKMVKGDLREQGYDLDLVDDPLYVMAPHETIYRPLERAFLDEIKAGKAGY
jgi:citronellyl-CoA synthetase